MISFIRKGILIIMACVGGLIGGCESKKVHMNKEQLTLRNAGLSFHFE